MYRSFQEYVDEKKLKAVFEEIHVLVHAKIKVASVKTEVLNFSLKVELTYQG